MSIRLVIKRHQNAIVVTTRYQIHARASSYYAYYYVIFIERHRIFWYVPACECVCVCVHFIKRPIEKVNWNFGTIFLCSIVIATKPLCHVGFHYRLCYWDYWNKHAESFDLAFFVFFMSLYPIFTCNFLQTFFYCWFQREKKMDFKWNLTDTSPNAFAAKM